MLARFRVLIYLLLSEGALRLVDPNTASTTTVLSAGQLQIYLRGQWGTVCHHNGFGGREADVACRQLGFSTATSYGSIVDLG